MSVKKILIALFVLAISLRLLYFKGPLTFFYDQARDAFAAMDIWQTDHIKILGPQTDLPGLHHGPFYWYLISLPYEVSGGNVWVTRIFLIVLSSFALFFIYDLAHDLFQNKKIGLLSAFFFAISFEAIAYSRWLSNPAPALLTSTISYWSLYKLIKGKSWAVITLLFSWGISVQLQLFLLYQLLIFVIIWILFKGIKLPKFQPKIYIYSLVAIAATFSTYIVSELKFHFQGTKTFLNFFQTQAVADGKFLKMFTDFIGRINDVFFFNIWGLNKYLATITAALTFVVSLLLIKKDKKKNEIIFLILWIVSPILISFLEGPSAHFITLGILPAVIILTVYLLYRLKTKSLFAFFLALLIIIVGNLNLVFSKNKQGDTLFTVQDRIIIGDELKVIDWIYKEADGKPFRLNTVTFPLFINSSWAYLFNWYANSTYGYIPYWWGETQVDVPGDKVKFAPEDNEEWLFIILDPAAPYNATYVNAIKQLEDSRSALVQTEQVGNFTIEKRKITNPDRVYTSQDVFYTVDHTNTNVLKQTE